MNDSPENPIRRDFTMRALITRGIIAAGILAPGAYASLILDHFQAPQPGQSVSRAVGTGGGNTAASTLGIPLIDSSATTIADLDREYFVNRTGGGSNTGVSLSSPVGTGSTYALLNITPDNTANRTAYGTIVYEAANAGDAIGENPDVFSLDLDLVSYGSAFDVAGFLSGSTAPSTPIVVSIYGSGANSNVVASATFNLTGTSPDQVVSIPFNQFTNYSQALFSSVGAIKVQLGATTGTQDINVNYLAVTGTVAPPAVPEPSSLLLFAGGLLVVCAKSGGRLLRRRG
jgi:hypothetical protein